MRDNKKLAQEANAFLKRLKPDCTTKERQRFIEAIENDPDLKSQYSPEMIQFVKDLDTQFQMMKPEIEAIQKQCQLTSTLPLLFILACIISSIIIHNL